MPDQWQRLDYSFMMQKYYVLVNILTNVVHCL